MRALKTLKAITRCYDWIFAITAGGKLNIAAAYSLTGAGGYRKAKRKFSGDDIINRPTKAPGFQ